MNVQKKVTKKKKQMCVSVGKATNLTLGHGPIGYEHNMIYFWTSAYTNKKS